MKQKLWTAAKWAGVLVAVLVLIGVYQGKSDLEKTVISAGFCIIVMIYAAMKYIEFSTNQLLARIDDLERQMRTLQNSANVSRDLSSKMHSILTDQEPRMPRGFAKRSSP